MQGGGEGGGGKDKNRGEGEGRVGYGLTQGVVEVLDGRANSLLQLDCGPAVFQGLAVPYLVNDGITS